ncbi:hypothetical protein EDB86DRAFT_2058194 [Lactarius hatsudake]|nr:hypothetical protein EDB86DRAFT_2058194 [Lactarius hatsudake]
MFTFFHCIVFTRVFILVFFSCLVWPHSIFGILISSHVDALTYIQHNYTRHFTYHSSDFTASQYTFLFCAWSWHLASVSPVQYLKHCSQLGLAGHVIM